MVAERDAELATARARLDRAAIEIERLRAQLAALRRARYGRSSEKLDQAIAQLELRLEDLEEGEAERVAAQPARQRPEARPRQPAVRKPLPAHLPREIVVHEPEMLCACTDPRLVRMGEA
jgi:transposase